MFGLFENLSMEFPLLPQTPGSLLRQSRAGRPYNIRPLKQGDNFLLSEFYRKLSAETLLNRYFVGRSSLSENAITGEIQRIYRVSKDNGCILAATFLTGDKEEIIGLGEMVLVENPISTGELALTVRDDFQREGVGSALASQLLREARIKGVSSLQGETMVYNRPMLRIWTKLGLPYSFSTTENVTTMTALLAP